MDIPLWRTGIFVSWLALLLVGERMAPYAPPEQKKWARLLFHLGISAANSILLYLTVTRPLLAMVAAEGARQPGLARVLGLSGWGEIIATLLVLDCWVYWMHRANHRIPFLWRFHRAHHSDMEVDVTTSARFHIGELCISNLVKGLVVVVWGPSMDGVVAFDLLLTACAQFHHGNLRIPAGVQNPLERLIVTPRMHRCHHALHPDCWNTNFATILSVWDRLGGSYHLATDPREMALIGLPKPRGPVTMQLVPFLLTPFGSGEPKPFKPEGGDDTCHP